MSRSTDARPAFWARIAALLIDYALILGWMAVLAAVSFTILATTGELVDWLILGTAGAQLLGFLVLVLPVGVYLYLSEASGRQATLGKRALHLRVVDSTTGERPSRSRILVRTIVKLLPWEIAHFAVWNVMALVAVGVVDFPGWLLAILVIANLLPIGYVLMVGVERERRGPHDLAARTRVVRLGATG